MINYLPDYEALPQLLCDYLHYIDAIKNRSQKTVFEYSLNLREFIVFVAIDKKLTDKNNPDIRFCDTEFFKNITLNDAYKFLSYCKNEKKNKKNNIREFYGNGGSDCCHSFYSAHMARRLYFAWKSHRSTQRVWEIS